MNSRLTIARTTSLFALCVIVASTSFAETATKRRAVAPGTSSVTVLLTGSIVDASTGAPVVGVLVTSINRSGHSDSQGRFFIKLTPGANAPLHFERAGYEPFDTSVNVTADASQTFRLIPKTTVQVRLTSGATYSVDPETVEFGYVAPFSGYNKDTKLNLCKSGGESFQPERAEIKRITTGAQINDAKCCAQGAVPAINVELKSGGTTTAAFVDACFGYKIDIIGLDHVTTQPLYLHFNDIAEVTFP